MEYNLRVSLLISQDDWSVFWTRPISLVILLATILVIFLPLIQHRIKAAVQQYRTGSTNGST